MRNLDTSAITTAVGMPVKSGTLVHIQNAYKESIAEAIKGLIGSAYSSAVMYALNGVVNSGSGSNYNISAGSVFFNGEVYNVDAAVFTLGLGQVAIGVLNITYFTGVEADGVEFDDGIVRNVHEIRKVVFQAGAGGTGMSNYVDVVRINANIPQVNITAGSGISVTGTYPNKVIASTIENPVLKTGEIFIGDLNSTANLDAFTSLLAGSSSSMSVYKYTFPVSLNTNEYIPVLTVGNQGHNTAAGFNDNFMCCVTVGECQTTYMYFAIQTTESGNTQSLSIRFALIKK